MASARILLGSLRVKPLFCLTVLISKLKISCMFGCKYQVTWTVCSVGNVYVMLYITCMIRCIMIETCHARDFTGLQYIFVQFEHFQGLQAVRPKFCIYLSMLLLFRMS